MVTCGRLEALFAGHFSNQAALPVPRVSLPAAFAPSTTKHTSSIAANRGELGGSLFHVGADVATLATTTTMLFCEKRGQLSHRDLILAHFPVFNGSDEPGLHVGPGVGGRPRLRHLGAVGEVRAHKPDALAAR